MTVQDTPTSAAELAGKIALATGGSKGIGLAVVQRLAADGACLRDWPEPS